MGLTTHASPVTAKPSVRSVRNSEVQAGGRSQGIAPQNIMVEVGEALAQRVPHRLLRRLIRLELGQLRLPDPHNAKSHRRAPAYVRVLPVEQRAQVELWYRGEFRGSRIVSLRGHGRLLARRLALAAAELARELLDESAEQARWEQLREAAARRASRSHYGQPLFARWTLATTGLAAVVGPSDLLLLGTQLEGRLRLDSDAQVGLFASLLGGPVFEDAWMGTSEWLELGLKPAYRVGIGELSHAVIGFSASAALQQWSRVRSVDGVEGATVNGNGRAVLELGFGHWLTHSLELEMLLEAGAAFRNVELVVPDSHFRHRAGGGLWLGVALSFVLDPGGATEWQTGSFGPVRRGL